MTGDRDRLYLRHMLEAGRKVLTYTQGIDQASFLETSIVQDAVIRQLEIVGEAARHVSPELQAENPQIRWRDMAGMRDRLIHGYFGVDLETVWATIQTDVPVLLRYLRSLVDE